MDRRSFLGSAAAGIAGAAVLSTPAGLLTSCASGTGTKKSPELRLSFQEGTAPGESLNEKFDYMEKLGIVGFEPHGKQLLKRAEEFRQALSGRNIKAKIRQSRPRLTPQCVNSLPLPGKSGPRV